MKGGRLEYRAHLLQRPAALGSHIVTANEQFASGRPDLAEHHADSRALSSTIVAKQAEDFTAMNRETEVVHGGTVAEMLGEVTQLDHGRGVHREPGRSRSFWMWPSA